MNIVSSGVELHGSVVHPPGARTAALLVPGSGKNDRDETVCGQRVFGVLAAKLASCGVATLRLDDRGVGGSGGDKDTCTHAELSLDARIARQHLERITGLPAGVIGHSEGAAIAVRAAVEDARVPWAVLLAGAGLPMEAVIHQQAETISRGAGLSEAYVQYERRMNEAVFQRLRAGQPVVDTLAAWLRNWPDTDPQDEAEIAANARTMAEVVSAPVFVSLLHQDPGQWLEQIRVPVLALAGSLDWQVQAEENLAAIRSALTRGGCPSFHCEVLPGLNHLFQEAATGAIEEYESLGEPMADIVVNRIAEWLTRIR